ncbi:12191_t:CDS:2, partial [Acaulospora morrowiae]
FDDYCIIGHHYFTEFPINGGRAVSQSLVPGDSSKFYQVRIKSHDSPDGPKNIPWLLIEAKYWEGKGAFSDISYVLRIGTEGGNPPSSAICGKNYKQGDIINTRFSTQNWFYKKQDT